MRGEQKLILVRRWAAGTPRRLQLLVFKEVVLPAACLQSDRLSAIGR